MTIITLKKRLQTLEERKNVKRELTWDCKNLMSRYRDESARQEISYKLAKIRGEACEPSEPYKIEVDSTRNLDPEAREFLSLSSERQGQAVNYYYPPGPPLTEEEREELTREILEKLNGIRNGREAFNG